MATGLMGDVLSIFSVCSRLAGGMLGGVFNQLVFSMIELGETYLYDPVSQD